MTPRTLTGNASSVTVYDHGAHVTSWKPMGTAEVLWLSPLAVFDESAAIRGGVPIVFPWFGLGRTGDMSPQHGFARTSTWTLLESSTSGDTVTARYGLTCADVTDPLFPNDYWATYEVRAGADLELLLTVRNTSDVTVSYEAVLHTYLAVADATTARVEGLDGVTYRDKVHGGAEFVQSGAIHIDGEIDRVYDSAADITVVDPSGGRSLVVRQSGTGSTVVWNPWIDKSLAMKDFPDDGWRTMVCVEGGCIGGNAVVLAPGETHTLGYYLSVTA